MEYFVSLILLVLLLAVVGFLTYLITTKIPMSDVFAQVIQVAVVIFCVLYILGVMVGKMPLPQYPFGR